MKNRRPKDNNPTGLVIGMQVATLGAMIAYSVQGDARRAAALTIHVTKELMDAVTDEVDGIAAGDGPEFPRKGKAK